MSLPDYERVLKDSEPHIEEVLKRVRGVIREGLRPNGTLKPSQVILDALYISQNHKVFVAMDAKQRLKFEKSLLRRLHDGKHAGIRCLWALHIAMLYAAMADAGERPAQEEDEP